MSQSRHVLLIVEDHEATRRTLARLLTLYGWEVRTAATIAEGLRLIADEPDWIILDLMLPDGDGEDILRRVKEAGLGTRVAVATGTHDPARLDAVRRLGADAVLSKPIDLDEVCRLCGPSPGPG